MTSGAWHRIAAAILQVARSPDFGRSDLRPLRRLTRRERAAFTVLLFAFLALALGADLLPGGRFHFEAQLARMTPFFELDRLTPSMRYYPGNAVNSFRSLPYMLCLKGVHALVPSRLLSLRLVSVAATAVSLVLMFHLAVRLFCPAVALLWMFCLVFSPVWLESMRAYGYLPFSRLFVVLGCFVLARPGEGKAVWGRATGLALSVYATLSLYLPAHLIFWLILVYLALDPRREWKTLALFLALFFGGTVLIDALIGDDPLNFRDFLLPEIGGEWVMRGTRLDWRLLPGHLVRNAPLLLRTLLPAGVFPPLLSAALIGAGTVLCLFLRRRSNLLALLWLGLFLFSPLTADAVPFRRIVFALDPVFLLAALSAWCAVRLAREAVPSVLLRRLLALSAVALLLFCAVVSSQGFLRETSRPEAKPSRGYLESLAAFILERGEASCLIMYDDPLSDLVWANPAFADRVSADLNPRVIAVSPALSWQLHQGGLERFPRPSIVIYRRVREEAYRELISRWAAVLGEGPVRGEVPGTDLLYAIIPSPPGLVPELASSSSSVTASSSRWREESAWVRHPNVRNNLTDGDPSQYWAPDPAAPDGPPWAQVDFGPGDGKTVRLLGLLPGGDPPSAEGFIRRGELLGGWTGREWERLAVIEEATPDPRMLWRYWAVDNDRAFRYYRLVVLEPSPGEFRGIGDIALYESENAYRPRFLPAEAIVRRAEK
jgi:hypothetical protein